MLKVQKRTCDKKKYGAFQLRKEGAIPGIVYGGGLEGNLPVRVDLKEFRAVLASGKHLVDLEADGAPLKVLIKAVQHGTYESEILHVDFRAISADETIEVELPIRLTNADDSEGKKAGGVVEQTMHSIPVRCVPAKLPDVITLDVTPLVVGGILHVSNLPAIDGVTYVAHGDPAVVTCHLPKVEAAAATAIDAAVPAAPEVIGEKEREEKQAAKDKDEGGAKKK